MQENKISLIVADDSNIVIECIKHWIKGSSKISLVGIVHKLEDLVSLVEINENAILLSSIHWVLKQGKINVSKMIGRHPMVKYTVIIDHNYYNSINTLADIGIKGFIGEVTTREELLQGLNDLKKYNYFMSPEILGDFLTTNQKENGYSSIEKVNLTKRETEILDLVLKGKNSKTIARSLSISKRTVDGHRSNINNKFGAKNTAQLYKTASKYLYTL